MDSSTVIVFEGRPQLGIEIALPAETSQIHATAIDYDAFRRKSLALLDELAAFWRKRKPSVCAQHAMPRQLEFVIRFTQHASDQTRPPRKTSTPRNFTIARNATAWNGDDCLADQRMSATEWNFH